MTKFEYQDFKTNKKEVKKYEKFFETAGNFVKWLLVGLGSGIILLFIIQTVFK